jgi:hypothetical protein
VSVSVQLGLLLALACAFTSIVGFLYKHRGSVEAPAVEFSRPVSSSLALFRSPWYTLGIVVATASWGLHVAALALAPISLVQTTIAGGLVLLTVIADRLFAHEVTRREWIGVALTAAGLAFLAATMGSMGDEAHADYEPATLAVYAGLAVAIGAILAVAASRSGGGPSAAAASGASLASRDGTLLAVSAGLLWGASDVTFKALSSVLDERGIGVLLHPLAAVIAILSLLGLLVSARSLQLGGAVAVIAVTSAAANIVTIASGPIVFGEPMPDDALGVTVRVLAFALVIGAAALTPPPVRAAEPRPA